MNLFVWSRCGTPYNWLLVADTQQQEAASRPMLRAGQRQR